MPESRKRIRDRFEAWRERGGRPFLVFVAALVAVTGALWGFLAVVDALADHEGVYYLDFHVRHLVRGWVRPDLTAWMIRITEVGSVPGTTALVVLVAVLLWREGKRRAVARLLFATTTGTLVFSGLKLLFHRPRPVDQLVPETGYSFPSGHAFMATVFYGTLIYLAWTESQSRAVRAVATTLGALMIVLIGMSRVYLGVHWMTDVLGGFLAGFLWLCLSLAAVHLAERRWERGGGDA
ncbi:phosphatase PAP2 family protein [Rhodocaloribacter sp.]